MLNTCNDEQRCIEVLNSFARLFKIVRQNCIQQR